MSLSLTIKGVLNPHHTLGKVAITPHRRSASPSNQNTKSCTHHTCDLKLTHGILNSSLFVLVIKLSTFN